MLLSSSEELPEVEERIAREQEWNDNSCYFRSGWWVVGEKLILMNSGLVQLVLYSKSLYI